MNCARDVVTKGWVRTIGCRARGHKGCVGQACGFKGCGKASVTEHCGLRQLAVERAVGAKAGVPPVVRCALLCCVGCGPPGAGNRAAEEYYQKGPGC